MDIEVGRTQRAGGARAGNHNFMTPDLPRDVIKAICKVLDGEHTAKVSRDHRGRYHVHVEQIERVYVSK